MDDVLVETLCTGALEVLEYAGVTASMWMEAPEDMINVSPPEKRALAVVLNARVRALLGQRRVLVQLNRAGVFTLAKTYAGVRQAAEHVQALLRVEYVRLHAGGHVDLAGLASVLDTDYDGSRWLSSQRLDNMHMLPTTHDGSVVELSVCLLGGGHQRAQLCLSPEVVVATFQEAQEETYDLPQPYMYEIWVHPAPAIPTVTRPSCFNDCTGYAYPSRDAARAAGTRLVRLGYYVSEPCSAFEWSWQPPSIETPVPS